MLIGKEQIESLGRLVDSDDSDVVDVGVQDLMGSTNTITANIGGNKYIVEESGNVLMQDWSPVSFED